MKSFILIFSTIFLVRNLSAQLGTLDISFADSGKIISKTYTGNCYSSLIQPDGKIVIGGSGSYYKKNILLGGSLLARYNYDGTADLNFADSGRGVYILGDSNYLIPTIYSLALQADTKIVALGSYAKQNNFIGFSLMRFNTDGSADKTFGTNGLSLSNFTGGDIPKDVALLSNGKIIVTGYAYSAPNENEKCFLSCYNTDGSLDKTFGQSGVVIIDLGFSTKINTVTITTDSKIILGGINDDNSKSILLKYNTDGSPDLSFGIDGFTEMSFDSKIFEGEVVNDILVDNEGNILAAGLIFLKSGKSCVLINRFNKDGTTDKNFGNNGYTYTEYKDGDAYGSSVATESDGKIIIGGYVNKSENNLFAVLKYTQTGIPDSSFGENGIQTTYILGSDLGYSVNLQKDEKIVLAGYSLTYQENSYRYSVELARYNNRISQKQIITTKIRNWLQHHNGLTWDANSSVSSYVVQRSYDGVHFNSIARIHAGNTSNYTYQDPMPLSGNNYYRLQTTGTDGSVNYSNVIAATANTDAIKISPNPAKNVLRIEGLSSSAKTKLTVVDFSGNEKMQAIANAASYNLNIASLKAGNYLLKIEMDGKVMSKKFMKE